MTERKTQTKVERLNRNELDDEQVSLKVAKALSGLSRGKMTTKDEKALSDEEKKKLAKRQKMHNIIVIDEVD